MSWKKDDKYFFLIFGALMLLLLIVVGDISFWGGRVIRTFFWPIVAILLAATLYIVLYRERLLRKNMVRKALEEAKVEAKVEAWDYRLYDISELSEEIESSLLKKIQKHLEERSGQEDVDLEEILKKARDKKLQEWNEWLDKDSESIKSDNHRKDEDWERESYLEKIEKSKDAIISKLENTILDSKLNRWIALGIGTIVSVIVVGLLIFSVLKASEKFLDQTEIDIKTFILSQIPKISLAIIVELFAVFFLRIYKNLTQRINTIQNEITNLELKYISLVGAITYQHPQAIENIWTSFAETERNFILNKGETTAEIEKAKIEDKLDNKLMEHLASLRSAMPFGGKESDKGSGSGKQ